MYFLCKLDVNDNLTLLKKYDNKILKFINWIFLNNGGLNTKTNTQLYKHIKENKYDYTIRFSVAATIVKSLFLGDISPPNAETLIRRNVSPVRPNRSYSRKPRAKAQIQFTYRIA